MWKSASRSFKSIFCKQQCSHNNVTTREARNDRSVNCFRKLSPTLFGYSHRSYGCEGQKRGSFDRNDQKEKTKTDRRNIVDNIQDLGRLRWVGIFAIGWYILKPMSHAQAIISQGQSDRCVFLELSRYTWNKYLQKLKYFIYGQPILHVLPKIKATQSRKDEADGFDFDNIERAHRSVVGSLNNLKGADCMSKGCYTAALKHFEEAARVQHPAAIYNLGVCYEMGFGTDQDFKKAAEMYKRASDLGHSTATYNLGVFYVHGLGDLKADLNQARKLFQVAASQGQSNAQEALNMERDLEAKVKMRVDDVVNTSETETSKGCSRQHIKLSSRKHDNLGKLNLFNVPTLIDAMNSDKTELDSSSLEDSGALDLSPEVQVVFN